MQLPAVIALKALALPAKRQVLNKFGHNNVSQQAGPGNARMAVSFNPPVADNVGWLLKVSLDGDSLWSRKLRFFEQGVDEENQEIFDLKEMPGGGYVMGGQTIYGNEPSGPI